MADSKPEQEPSIEEILASIRQIISDDDASAEKPAAKPVSDPAPAPAVVAEPEPIVEEEAAEEDVLELTLNMKEEPEDSDIIEEDPDLDADFEIALAEINETLASDIAETTPEPVIEEPEDMPAPVTATEPVVPDDSFEDILSEQVKSAALSSMAKLASGMPISKPAATPRHYQGVTLEDIVRDLLNPMLRDWMDDNLPPLVERLVQKELEKLARKALDS